MGYTMKKIAPLPIILVLSLVISCTTVPKSSLPAGPTPSRVAAPTALPGSGGIFGTWIIDRFGLPAYRYTMDETTDPRAEWDPEIAPRTNLMWFPIGNKRIVAAAYNHGFVELFYNESDQRWINHYDPDSGNYTGGFGFVREGDEVVSTFFPDRPPEAEFQRIYGMGYFEKTLTQNGLRIDQVVFAPKGSLPVLISEVTIDNLSTETRTLTYYEYWDLNMVSVSKFLGEALFGEMRRRSIRFTPRFVPDRGLLILEGNKVWGTDGGFPPGPRSRDIEPPSVFLASLSGEVTGYAFDQTKLLPVKTAAPPSTTLTEIGLTPDASITDDPADNCLVLAVDITLSPGQSRTLRFAFGYAKAVRPEQILDRLGDSTQLLTETVSDWRERIPEFHGPADDVLAREVAWDYYALNALSLTDGYYQTPFIPQGGNYLFRWGSWGVTRDLAAFAQTLIYYSPEAAKDQLRFILRGQGVDGRFFYAMAGFGDKHQWYYQPSDFDLWVIGAVVEYVFVTRDLAFLDEVLPFYPKESGEAAPVREHLRRAFEHLRGAVGTGRHGLLRLRLSDWNDEMTFLTARGGICDVIGTWRRGESVFNTAMAAAVLPGYAELSRITGDTETARRVDEWAGDLTEALKAQWTDPGWLIRSYSGRGVPFGKDHLFLEPQIWALMADGVLTDEQAHTLINNIKARLMEPSVLGMMISDLETGSRTTRPGQQEEGGIWFAMNGPAVVALARYDPELAWRELMKNTLARHAEVYPGLWMGIWSGPDSFNSAISDRPGQSWYQQTPLGGIGPQEYPVMNAHSHAQILYALARLAGITGTLEGLVIDPRIPYKSFTFTTRTFSVEKSPASLSGCVTMGSDGEMVMRVRAPVQGRISSYVVTVDGKRVESILSDDFLRFRLPFKEGVPARWEVRGDGSTDGGR
jgi:hypothetical protein